MTLAVLQVLEYESIGVGECFDPELRTLTAAQMVCLEAYANRYKARTKCALFKHGPKGALITQNIVGVLPLGEHQIEILPKIQGAADVRSSLVGMIHRAYGLPLFDAGNANTEANAPHVLDVMVRLFCRELWRAVHSGLVHRYEPRTDQLSMLRGRLNISQQIALNAARPDRLHCTYEEFTADHLLNQTLKAALLLLARLPLTTATARSVQELLICFDEVSVVGKQALLAQRLPESDRLVRRYLPLIKMARLFLQQSSPDVVSGVENQFSLLFDMNELFESYIAQVVKQVARQEEIRVILQGPRNHLALDEAGSPRFELRPDIALFSSTGGIVGLIDTKWKRLEESKNHMGVSQADMYQMAAYAGAYQAPQVTLLYPFHQELDRQAGLACRYRLKLDPEKEVRIATVDLRDLATVPTQLSALIFSVNRMLTGSSIEPVVC